MRRTGWVAALALAFVCAGNGVFAEGPAEQSEGSTFRVFGVLHTGITMQFTDMQDDGPFIFGGSTERADPLYLLIKASWASAGNNFGIDSGVILRGSYVETNTIDQSFNVVRSIRLDNTWGWIRFLEGMFTLYGGLGEWEYDFLTPGPIDSNLNMDGLGMVLVARPLLDMPGHDLRVGLSAFVGGGHDVLLNEGKYIFSAAYQFNDTFEVVGNFAFRQYGPRFFADPESINYCPQRARDHRINIGFNFLGLSHLGFSRIAMDAEMRDLGGGRTSIRDPIAEWGREGSTVYPLFLGQRITWGSGPLNLDATFRQTIRIGDDHEDYAPALKFMLRASYALNDFIIPRIGLLYVMNSRVFGDTPGDMRFHEGLIIDECERDQAGFGFLAGVQFRPFGGDRTIIEVGYSLKMDLGRDAQPGRGRSTVDHGVYVSMSIHF